MKKGLVLEGGGMRGLFTVGVTDVLMENSITFDGAIGVSAGAAFGCNYKSGQAGRAIRYNTRFSRDKRYCSIGSLIRTGDLFSADFCYKQIPRELDKFDDEAYDNNPMEFYVVCTDIETGEPVYKSCPVSDEAMLEYIRASASLPLVANIVEIDDKKLLDGGITDSIPLKYFESIGYNKNVVILTQPKNYVKKANRAMPIIKRKYKGYPKLIEAMKNRYLVYNKTLKYVSDKEVSGDVLVIRPSEKLPIGRVEHDADTMRAVYDLGRSAGEESLNKIREFLK